MLVKKEENKSLTDLGTVQILHNRLSCLYENPFLIQGRKNIGLWKDTLRQTLCYMKLKGNIFF